MNKIALRYSAAFEQIDKRLFFLLLCVLVFSNNVILNNFILTDKVFYQTLGEQLSVNRISEYLSLREKLKVIGYFFIPVALVIKLLLIAMCINIGALFADYEIGFGKIFKITVLSEIVFIIGNLIRSFILFFFMDVQKLSDAQQFYPFSVMNLVNANSIEKWLHYPLVTLNIFEVAYVFICALGVSHITGKPYASALKFTAITYGIGLIVWLCFIVFLSINFT